MNRKDDELVFVQTEGEYKKGVAKAWTDEDMLRSGTYKVRRLSWAE